jgi:ABC-2 type transport system ATP-binding protein
LDEPTAGVDIELRNMLWENVRKLNEQGMTIILTTHYLEEAEEMCDEIAIINHGEKVAQDTTQNLLGRVDAKTLLITPSEGDPSMIILPQGVEMSVRDGGRVAFSYNRKTTPADAILDALRAAGVKIADVRTEEAALEEVFLALTKSA